MEHKADAVVTHTFTMTEDEAVSLTLFFAIIRRDRAMPQAVGNFFALLSNRNSQ